MEGAKKRQSFQHGAAVLLCSAAAVKLIGALFKIPLSSSRCLGDLGFGYFSSAYDLFTPVYTLAMAGLPVAAAKIVAEHAAQGRYADVRRDLKLSRRVYFAAGLAGFLLLLLLIYPYVRITDPSGNSAYSLIAMAPSVFFCFIMSAYRGYYEGLGNMYPTAVSELIEALCKLVLGLGFGFAAVRVTGSVVIAAAAAVFGITVGTACAALYLRLRLKIKGDGISPSLYNRAFPPESSGLTAKALILIALPVAAASLAGSIPLIADALTVKWQLGVLMEKFPGALREMYSGAIAAYEGASLSPLSDSELPTMLYGVRSKAYTLYNLIPALTSVLSVSAVPSAAAYAASGDGNGLRKSVDSVLKWSALISFPAGVGFIAAGGRIMELLYDTEASAEIGGPLLRIFGAAVLFAGPVIPLTGILQAMGKYRTAMINIAAGAAVKILVGAVTVSLPRINILGAALSTLACFFIIFILHITALVSALKSLPDVKTVFLKPLFASVLCGACAFGILRFGDSSFITVLALAVSALVYAAVLIAVKALDESDFSTLPKGEKITRFCKKYRIIR